MNSLRLVLTLAGAGLAGALLITVLDQRHEPPGATSGSPATTTSSAQQEPSQLSNGLVGYLHAGSAKTVPVAITDGAWHDFNRARLAGDDVRMGSMIEAGLILPVRSGTRVRIIHVGFAIDKISIAEGAFAGVEGCLPREYVR